MVTRTIRNRLLVIGLLATLGFVAVADLFIGTFNWPAALCGLVNLVGAAVWTHILRDYLVRVVLA